jgi:hypothetical protein
MMTDHGIHRALLSVADGIGPMNKQEIKGQGYKAFTIDDIYTRVRPLLVKAGIVVIPKVLHIEYEEGAFKSGTAYTDARVVMSYRFVFVDDGSSETFEMAGEGRDTQDKASNKAAQQAFKFALIQAFQVATGEPDPEEDPGGGDEPAAKPKRKGPKDWENEAKILVWETVDEDKDEAAKWFKTALAATEVGKVTTKAGMEKVVRWVQSEFVGVGAAEVAHGDGPQPPEQETLT